MVDKRQIHNKCCGDEHLLFSEEFIHNYQSNTSKSSKIDLDNRRKLYDTHDTSSSTNIVINLLFGE